MVDYEQLYFLRKYAHLNVIDFIKVRNLRKIANETQLLINRLENCQIGVDYKEADEFEFNARFNTWMHDNIGFWMEYSDGMSLEDFAWKLLNDSISAQKEENNERHIRQRIK